MFEPAIVAKLLTPEHRNSLAALARVEDQLSRRFAQLDDAIRALVLAVACGEPLLLIGPPGTAKSRLVRAFCELVGITARDDGYFEYLLTPFTEPAELFGYYDLAALQSGRLVRLDDGMMQHARVVFLDEVFNGSSAILNSILAFMNERVFHDRGLPTPVQMQCMLSATNDIPTTPELRAVFDRFLIRAWLEPVEADPGAVSELVGRGWAETYGRDHNSRDHISRDDDGDDHAAPAPVAAPSLIDDLRRLRDDLRRQTRDGRLAPNPTDAFYTTLVYSIQVARSYGASAMSNRRLVKMSMALLVHRLYRAVRGEGDGDFTFARPELDLIWRHFLDEQDPLVVDRIRHAPLGTAATIARRS